MTPKTVLGFCLKTDPKCNGHTLGALFKIHHLWFCYAQMKNIHHPVLGRSKLNHALGPQVWCAWRQLSSDQETHTKIRSPFDGCSNSKVPYLCIGSMCIDRQALVYPSNQLSLDTCVPIHYLSMNQWTRRKCISTCAYVYVRAYIHTNVTIIHISNSRQGWRTHRHTLYTTAFQSYFSKSRPPRDDEFPLQKNTFICVYIYIRQMPGLCLEPQPRQTTHHHHHHHHHHHRRRRHHHHHHHHHHQTLVEDLQNKDRSLTEVRELNPYWRSSMNVEV